MAPLSPSQGRLAPKLTPLPCLASGIAPVGILWDSCQGAESLTGFHERKAVGQPLTVSEDEYAGGAKVGCADFPAPFRAGGGLRSSVRTLGGYRVANPVPRRAQGLDGEAVKPY